MAKIDPLDIILASEAMMGTFRPPDETAAILQFIESGPEGKKYLKTLKDDVLLDMNERSLAMAERDGIPAGRKKAPTEKQIQRDLNKRIKELLVDKKEINARKAEIKRQISAGVISEEAAATRQLDIENQGNMGEDVQTSQRKVERRERVGYTALGEDNRMRGQSRGPSEIATKSIQIKDETLTDKIILNEKNKVGTRFDTFEITGDSDNPKIVNHNRNFEGTKGDRKNLTASKDLNNPILAKRAENFRRLSSGKMMSRREIDLLPDKIKELIPNGSEVYREGKSFRVLSRQFANVPNETTPRRLTFEMINDNKGGFARKQIPELIGTDVTEEQVVAAFDEKGAKEFKRGSKEYKALVDNSRATPAARKAGNTPHFNLPPGENLRIFKDADGKFFVTVNSPLPSGNIVTTPRSGVNTTVTQTRVSPSGVVDNTPDRVAQFSDGKRGTVRVQGEVFPAGKKGVRELRNTLQMGKTVGSPDFYPQVPSDMDMRARTIVKSSLLKDSPNLKGNRLLLNARVDKIIKERTPMGILREHLALLERTAARNPKINQSVMNEIYALKETINENQSIAISSKLENRSIDEMAEDGRRPVDREPDVDRPARKPIRVPSGEMDSPYPARRNPTVNLPDKFLPKPGSVPGGAGKADDILKLLARLL